MRKKHLRMFRRILAGAAILTILVPVRAQVSNPSTWSSFVKGSKNTSVVDTFRMQTFSGTAGDNWEYTLENGAVVEEGLKGLKVPLKGKVLFEPYSLESFQRVSAVITFSVHSIVTGEKLLVELDNNGGITNGTVYPINTPPALSVRLGSNPCRLDFKASAPATKTKNGYFLIDSVYAYDTIPKHSLFTGAGNWNDKNLWSHLPPLRHRCALINGSVTISSPISCQTASLSNGSLNITEGARFAVDTLFLHNTDFALTVAGELSVNKQVTTYYTFPEKGKWYFLSFPFDVSLKGIDNRFLLKDNTFAGSGDYLYIQTYDGDKRASTQKPTDNWKVSPEPSSSDNPVIFEKGKGYLVALDAAASDNTLTFSADKEHIPDGFGKTASIPITTSSSGDADTDHCGWSLCGNPLPAPLQLSQIKADPALDGKIYLYDGNTYKAYTIGSDFALPPFAAFFVKATAATELIIANTPSTANTVLLKSGFSLRSELTEPTDTKTNTSKIEKKTAKSILQGNTLYLDNLPSAGKVNVMDIAGRVVYSRVVSNGSSVLPLSLRSGWYIVIVEAGDYCAQHKCVLTQ